MPANLDVLLEALESARHTVLVATDGSTAIRIATAQQPALILLDVVMPGMNGHDVCRQLKADERTRDIPIIFVTMRDDSDSIVAGFEAGAVDYLVKPFRLPEVLSRVGMHLERAFLERLWIAKNDELNAKATELELANDELADSYRRSEAAKAKLEEEIARRERLDNRLERIAERENAHWGITGFIGKSPTVRQVLENIAKLQNASAVSVMITGESGTGKELIARAIHSGSTRAHSPFVAVNCATISADLAESLLFGHRKGAFTGADRDQSGYFDMADGGTLFLDEVGAMPSSVQPKLLRVLEDGRIRPLGTSEEQLVDVRVLSATNEALSTLREDLYFRLARYTVNVPPLRERGEDIAMLAQHFLQLFAAEMNVPAPAFSADALAQICAYGFPGNVRELKNIVERALIESSGHSIKAEDLRMTNGPATSSRPPSSSPLRADVSGASTPSTDAIPVALADIELAFIKQAVARAQGNVSEAARALGVDRNKIYRRLAAERKRRSP